MKKKIIYGASGHGKVIADIIQKRGEEVMGFVDDDESKWESLYAGYRVLGGRDYLIRLIETEDIEVVIGVGDNFRRRKVFEKLAGEKIHFGVFVHPSAQLGTGVTIGEGTVVMANCVVNPDTRIGRHCIVNTAATIDHDTIIGDFVHISPGAHLGGGVEVGDFTWVGLGAAVIQNIILAENCIIGAGSVVIRDVEADSVVVGHPATLLRKNRHGV